jgi:hypothetical protein
VLPAVVDGKGRADQQVLHRARDRHLTVGGAGRDPGRDVDGQPAEVGPGAGAGEELLDLVQQTVDALRERQLRMGRRQQRGHDGAVVEA